MLDSSECELTLSSGEKLCGPVHASWKLVDVEPLLTTLDLHAAYKQLAIAPTSRPYSVIVLTNPHSKQLGCFVGNALPFGSTASVVYFNRVSRLIWRLGLELFLPWCNYYDDATCHQPMIEHYLDEKNKKKNFCLRKILLVGKPKKLQLNFVPFEN